MARRLNWLKLFSGAVGMGSWGLFWWYLRVPPIPLGGWGTGNTPHLPPKCPWQNLPQQPRKPGHQTAGGGRGPGVRAAPPPAPRAVYWHPGRPPPGWFGRGGRIRGGGAKLALLFFSAVKNLGLRPSEGKVSTN